MNSWRLRKANSILLAGGILAMGATAAASQAAATARPGAFREIADPASGARWLLVPDEEHPGGPGKFVKPGTGTDAVSAPAHKAPAALPVIRAGDRLVIEQHEAALDARLEAVALVPAERGARFAVRLRAGSRVVHAIAVAPGRAILAPEREAKP